VDFIANIDYPTHIRKTKNKLIWWLRSTGREKTKRCLCWTRVWDL